jgi:DNA polymerase elongation subunit (family B)
MKKRVRLYPEEAKYLGFEVKPNDPNRRNTRYMLDEIDLKMLQKLRSHQTIKRLFFDIETSPNVGYFWRAGYKQNISYENIIQERKIICISYKWEGSEKVHTLTWDKNQCDKEMLEKFVDIANIADELVGHNGDRFDIKWIRTRCVFHRVPMFPKYRTLDTLKKSRGAFYFNSNRLDYIAQYLGVGAKVKHDGFSMWVDVMNGDKKALDDMVRYCEGDVVVLEDVYHTIKHYVLNNTHAGVITGNFKHSCPQCGNEDAVLLKNNVTAKGTIKRLMECDSCEYVYEISNTAYKNTL